MKSSISLVLVVLGTALAGCPAEPSPLPCSGAACSDGGVDGDVACTRDEDCDDGRFCNGAEECTSGSCEAGAVPCASGCDEAADRCDGPLVDVDRDGDPASADCDDENAARYHGAVERCDAIDNDCDPSTLGRDEDGDGDPAPECCNEQPDGTTLCGDDCDDTRDTVNSTAVESCNRVDDDCDGSTDEMVETTYYEDVDGDGYGSSVPGAPTMQGCIPPLGYAPTNDDCDDRLGLGRGTNPGNREVCDIDEEDENCDGSGNEGCGCPSVGASEFCCAGRGTRTCVMTPTGSMWDECTVLMTTETCNGIDDDCDGTPDDSPLWPAPPPGLASPACFTGARGLTSTGGSVGTCHAGTWFCDAGSPRCAGESTPAPDEVAQCALDLDCDGDPYENFECDPTSGMPRPDCGICAGDRPWPATQACASGTCTLGACTPTPGYTWTGRPATDPWFNRAYSYNGRVCAWYPYDTTGVTEAVRVGSESGECGILSGPSMDLPAGNYRFTIIGAPFAGGGTSCASSGAPAYHVYAGDIRVEITAAGTPAPIEAAEIHPAEALYAPNGLQLEFTLPTCRSDVRVRVATVNGQDPGMVIFGCIQINSVSLTRL